MTGRLKTNKSTNNRKINMTKGNTIVKVNPKTKMKEERQTTT